MVLGLIRTSRWSGLPLFWIAPHEGLWCTLTFGFG